jgi:hypothetical protein
MDQIKKTEIKTPEKKISSQNQETHFDWDKEKNTEKKEISSDEKIVSDELRREVELMQIDGDLKKEAEQKANKIQFLADDDKLKNLLQIAREKGIVYAIKVAKSMNDPFILDTLHDALAREGCYKDFIK